MSRYTLRKVCNEPGCKEWASYAYDTLRERREGAADLKKWLCVRHTDPDRVLSPATPAREIRLVSGRGPLDKLYWGSGSGFMFGPNFKAWADDFPEGSTLVMTARVESPEDERSAAPTPLAGATKSNEMNPAAPASLESGLVGVTMEPLSEAEPDAWQDPTCPRHVISAGDRRDGFREQNRNTGLRLLAEQCTRPLYASVYKGFRHWSTGTGECWDPTYRPLEDEPAARQSKGEPT